MSNRANLRIRVPVKQKNTKEFRIQQLSPILGARGIKPNEFLMKFDDLTKEYNDGDSIIVHLLCETDNRGKVQNYKIKLGTPTVAAIVKKLLNIEIINSKSVTTVSNKIVDQIVEIKRESFYMVSDENIRKMIIGSLRSMSITIKD